MVKVEVPRNPTPAFGQVVGERPLEVLRVEEDRPALVSGGLRVVPRFGQRQRHPGVAEQLAHRVSLEGQPVGGNQKTVADLRDAEHVVGQRLAAVEERPARRRDLGAVTVGRRVQTELRRTVVETIPRPVAEAAFHRLKHAPVGRPTLRPVVAGDGSRRTQRFGAIVTVVRGQPGRRKADLEVADRPIDQRPNRRIETRAVAVGFGAGAGVAPDISVQPAVGEFNFGLGWRRVGRRILRHRRAGLADCEHRHQKYRGD